MAKVKKSSSKRKLSRAEKTFYGLEHEFVLIGGGGFLVIVVGMILFTLH